MARFMLHVPIDVDEMAFPDGTLNPREAVDGPLRTLLRASSYGGGGPLDQNVSLTVIFAQLGRSASLVEVPGFTVRVTREDERTDG